jgi:hypothetical protein
VKRDPLRFCARCHKLRQADTFAPVTRQNGQVSTVCGRCVEALEKARSASGRDTLLARDRAERLQAARAWSQFANSQKKKKRKGDRQ